MLQIERLIKDKRLSQAILGISGEKLLNLVGLFEKALNASKKEKAKTKQRAHGAGQKGKLSTSLEKLIFILFYCKVYPTFDVCAYLFGMDRSQSCRWVHKLLPILEKSLGYACVLPARQIRSAQEFFDAFRGSQDIFVDGTERPVQKKVNKKASNKNYSGKAKRHTKKVIVICDEKKRINYLSKIKSGRRHDKKLFDKEDIERHIPDDITIWGDSGFQGILHHNRCIPKKSSKNNILTTEEKENNRVISGLRVVVEHAIGGMKRLGCMANIYRNRKPNMDDQFALLSAGIWNLHLQAA
jgi:DDE superfamily endonuclease/Helix-turn-helix of DDE superfamily endonuclease